jgi:hypothetical protein
VEKLIVRPELASSGEGAVAPETCAAVDPGAPLVKCDCGKLRQAGRGCGANRVRDLKFRPNGQ